MQDGVHRSITTGTGGDPRKLYWQGWIRMFNKVFGQQKRCKYQLLYYVNKQRVPEIYFFSSDS